MGKLKETMLMKTNAHFINNPGWGISFMIDNHKFHAKEGSDLCDLVRSIIMDSVDSIKRAIDIRGYEEGIIYTRTNEPNIKRERGTAIFDQKNLFEAIKQEVKTPTSVKITKRLVGTTKFKEIKAEEPTEPKKEAKVSNIKTVVNIAAELDRLMTPSNRTKVEVVKEVVTSPSVTKEFLQRINSEINKAENKETEEKVQYTNNMKQWKDSYIKSEPSTDEEKIYFQYMNKLIELNTDKLKRDDVRKYKIRTESPLFNKSHSTFLQKFEEWKKEQETKSDSKSNTDCNSEEVFKLYESILLKKHVEKLSRDEAVKSGIKYRKISKDNYGMFLEMYKNWKMKK